MVKKYSIIEITTKTCSVCRMLAPMVNKTLENYPQVSLDIYDYEAPEVKTLLTRYSIKSVPAFFFIKDNEVVDSHFGAIAMPELKTKINNLINEA